MDLTPLTHEEDTNDDKQLVSFAKIWAFAAVAFVAVVGIYLYNFRGHPLSSNPEDWARFGEYVGGTLGAVYGLIGILGVLLTIREGSRATIENRAAHANELRPWIKVKTEVGQRALNWHGSNSTWEIQVDYRLENVGKTPAKRVYFDSFLIPYLVLADGPEEERGLGLTDVASELRAFAMRTKERREVGLLSNVMFPNEPSTGSHSTAIADSPERQSRNFSGEFVLLCCVVYQSSVDDSWHETAEARAIIGMDISGTNVVRLNPGNYFRVNAFPHPRADNYVT
ncbi:MAG TPA: hypothetical protein VGI93_20345 [Steroidobacteraceae bacterium]|jgi:hypothetical protein